MTEPRPAAGVTLVHGTWARRARWSRSGSEFSRALEAELGVPIAYRRFTWGGWNRISTRRSAVGKLAKSVENSAVDYPGVPQFVIAHSHGGNIAFDILRLQLTAMQRSSLRGVVCLATPFLTLRPRAVDTELWRIFEFVVRLALHAIAFVVALLHVPGDWSSHDFTFMAVPPAVGAATVFAFRGLD